MIVVYKLGLAVILNEVMTTKIFHITWMYYKEIFGVGYKLNHYVEKQAYSDSK